MKKTMLLMFVFILGISTTNAQEGFNYQALVRNSSGEIMQNETINISFNIKETSTSGVSVYSETHALTTNNFGNIVAIIGQGTVDAGIFADIDWAGDLHFLNVKIDGTDMGTTQFMAVPYAKHAETASELTNPVWTKPSIDVTYTSRTLALSKFVSSTNPNFISLSKISGGFPSVADNVFEINRDGDVTRPSISGVSNMLPIAYGTVQADGTINISSSNVLSVTYISAGRYDIQIENESINTNEFIVNINPMDYSQRNVSWASVGTNLSVYCRNIDTNVFADSGFSFVIYKP